MKIQQRVIEKNNLTLLMTASSHIGGNGCKYTQLGIK
jgi:hypothetical protein